MISTNCTVWYVEPLDPRTNQIISFGLFEEDACFGKKCADGETHNLWRCRHLFVSSLEQAKKELGLQFRIYVQNGRHGQIKRWPFQNKSGHRRSRDHRPSRALFLMGRD